MRNLILIHSLLALSPLCAKLVAFWGLPAMMVLYTTPLAQAMLLSTWIGIFEGDRLRKVTISAGAVLLITVSIAAGQVLMNIDDEPMRYVISRELFVVGTVLSCFVVGLSLLMEGARQQLGTVSDTHNATTSVPQYRYSLLGLLAIPMVVAIVLTVSRAARQSASLSDASMYLSLTMFALAFAINQIAAVWAVFGPGHLIRRIFGVLAISLVLGLCAFYATGQDFLNRLYLLSFALPIVGPTLVVVATFLSLRRQGYRLVRLNSAKNYDRATGQPPTQLP